MKTKPTLTIGIPAHNETNNIAYVLRSILKQRQHLFRLEKIMVLCDGCTDDTQSRALDLTKNHPTIKVFSDGMRMGKASRLNQIYRLNQSDYVMNLDADVVFAARKELDSMIEIFLNDPNAMVVAGHMEPIKPQHSFIANILYTSHILWDEIRLSISNGDHISNLYGSASMLTKDFSKSFKFPSGITCDEEYLYVMAKKREGFRYAFNTRIYYQPPATIAEFKLQATRFLYERYSLVPRFGKEVIKLHHIPLSHKLRGLIKMFLKTPFYTTMAIAVNVWARLSPHLDDSNKRGLWQSASSTKINIAESMKKN